MEVCRGGVWGAVYDYSGWDFNDAKVTCRQLGYPSECELVCTCEYIVVLTHRRRKHLEFGGVGGTVQNSFFRPFEAIVVDTVAAVMLESQVLLLRSLLSSLP